MLPVAVLALCLNAVLCAPSLDPQLDEHWELWKSWHTKKYHEVMHFLGFFFFSPKGRFSLQIKKGGKKS